MFQYQATVVNIVDGDTVDLRIDLGFDIAQTHSIRLYGINAPEHTQKPEGPNATAALAALLPVGSTVTIDTYKDRTEKYGRYLGTITNAAGVIVNDEMVKSGHAVAYFGGKRS